MDNRHWALSLITPPYAEPLSLSEAKRHLRIESSVEDDDALITGLIIAAREYVENWTGRRLIAQTWDLKLPSFPSCSGVIRIPGPPLLAVSAITYIDTAGATQTLATTEYIVDTDSEPGRVALAYNKTWPSTENVIHAVTIRFLCGYATPFTVDASADMLTLKGRNAPTANTPVRVWSTGTLPSSLKTLTDYYITAPSSNTCQLAATSGGSAIDLTTRGDSEESHFIGTVPESLRAAMKLMVGDLYENRERGMVGTIYSANPSVDALLGSYRISSVI